MRYRTLGKSPLQVSELCLGTMMFADQTDLAEARRWQWPELILVARSDERRLRQGRSLQIQQPRQGGPGHTARRAPTFAASTRTRPCAEGASRAPPAGRWHRAAPPPADDSGSRAGEPCRGYRGSVPR